MGSFAHAAGWAAYVINLVWALWFGIGLVVGGILLARDEWRLYRTRPTPEEVKAYADDLMARHGREAFRINGDAMVAARDAKAFQRYRFLKEVSGELVQRLFANTATG